MSIAEGSILFFLQLTVILTVCRHVGFIGKKIGQQVVCEMTAGVLMGSSLFGLLEPDFGQ
jgi:Kef-type K+ transport system membrane component KefB